MIERPIAIEIANRFLEGKNVDFERFEEANYIPEDGVWACIFSTQEPIGAVDSPGIVMVIVNCVTGVPSFFDTM